MDTPRGRSDILLFGQFRLDRRGGGLFRYTEDGSREPMDLGSRALDVLWVLVDRHGELVSKDEIMATVWPDTVVEESNLSVHISALRRALGAGMYNASWIQTVPGRGYRFVGAVTRRAADIAAPPSVALSRADISPMPAPNTTPLVHWWVGRSVVLDTLEYSLKQVVDGNRQLVFVTGEAGIGKTTLIEMAIERMSGVGILYGRCIELFGTEEAFLPLIDALLEGCRGPNRAVLLTALRDHAPTWLAQMPGHLGVGDRAAFQSEVFGATRERMLREFCNLLEVLTADRPWVFVLEDLHWSDFATLDALSRLARQDRKESLLIVATYRPIDVMTAKHPIQIVHQDLQIHGRCRELALDRLSLADVKQYLALRFDHPAIPQALAERIFARTNGHPLFVVTLVDHLVAQEAILYAEGHWRLGNADVMSLTGMPRDLRDMINLQIDRLSADARRLLEVASAAGADFSAAVVAGAMGVDILEVESTCETLAREGHILTTATASEWPDGTFSGSYSFQHALYQEALYQRLAPGQRAQTHRRLGERLEAGFLDQTADIASVLALHFETGRDFAKATYYLSQAADGSTRRFGNREAVNYLSRALDLVNRLPATDQPVRRIRLLQQRGWARRSAGDLVGSLQDLNAMVAHAEDATQGGLEVTGLLDISRFSFLADRRQSLHAAERALAKSQEIEDDVLRISVQGLIAGLSLYLRGWTDDDAKRCQDAIKITAEARDPRILTQRYTMQGILACLRSDYLACCAAATHGKERALEVGDVYSYSLYNTLESVALIHLGRWRELRSNTAATLAMADKNANQEAGVLARLTIAWLHVEMLDFEGARERCEAIRGSVLEVNAHIFFFCRTVLAKAYLGLRDHAAAWAQLDALTQRIEVEGVGLSYTVYAYLYGVLCEYWLEIGVLGKAREHAVRLHDYVAPGADRYHLALAHGLFARIALAQGALTEAGLQVSDAVSTLGDAALPGAAWRIYLTAAACYAGADDRAAAADYRLRLEAVIQDLATNFDQDDPSRASWITAVATEARRQNADAET